MATAIKWSTPGTLTQILTDTGVAPTLKNLANGSKVLSSEVDNATDKNQYAVFELWCRFGTNPTGPVNLYIVPCVDGTNYSTGDGSNTPPTHQLIFSYLPIAITTQQRLVTPRIELPPFKFKVVIENQSGFAMTNTNGENMLNIRTYNDEIQ